MGIALGAGCQSPTGPGATALHQLHPSVVVANPPTLTADFYALPFPNDLRHDPDGTLDLSLYPRVGGLLDDYVNLADQRLTGFGTNGCIYFRFDAPVDASSLPADAAASVADGATAFVVDVTRGSPTWGKRTPVVAHFVKDAYQFIGPNWVALLPLPGFPLREQTTYAALLTDGLRAADRGPIRRAADFDAAMQQNSTAADAKIAKAQLLYRPLFDWLSGQPGLAAHLVNATVFTTVDATSILGKLRDAVYAQAPAPSLAGLTAMESAATYQVYEASYPGPNFQTGQPPYASAGGDLMLDASGVPRMQRLETLRVAMSIPTGTMPPAGWPVVIYAHGTGGDYRSFLRDGSGAQAANVTARDGSVLAKLAMISIDQVLHGTRAPQGTNVELAFYNFLNPVAALANVKQGALDDFQLVRLVKAIDGSQTPFKLDPAKIFFKGHSQGGLTGPLFLAFEPGVSAAVLSGAGGGLVQSLLTKTMPVDIGKTVAALLADPADPFHPLLNLVQSLFESSDPINYARLLFREPKAGISPKSVYQSLGIVDHFAPVPTIEALALALGVQPVAPRLLEIAGLELGAVSWATAPVVANVAGGAATGVLLEYPAPPNADGHFVVFDVPVAIAQSNRFLASASLRPSGPGTGPGIPQLDPP